MNDQERIHRVGVGLKRIQMGLTMVICGLHLEVIVMELRKENNGWVGPLATATVCLLLGGMATVGFGFAGCLKIPNSFGASPQIRAAVASLAFGLILRVLIKFGRYDVLPLKVLAMISVGVGWACFVWFLKRLATRLRDPDAERRGRRLLRVMAAYPTIGLAMVVAAPFLPQEALALYGLVLLIMLLYAYIVLNSFHKLIRTIRSRLALVMATGPA